MPMHTNIHTYIRTYLCTCIHTLLHTMHICKHFIKSFVCDAFFLQGAGGKDCKDVCDSAQSPILLRNLATPPSEPPSETSIKLSKYIYKVPTTHVPGCDGQCLSSGMLGNGGCGSAAADAKDKRNKRSFSSAGPEKVHQHS